jgi:RNA polymerase sigma-70 factor (sigma-E family)
LGIERRACRACGNATLAGIPGRYTFPPGQRVCAGEEEGGACVDESFEGYVSSHGDGLLRFAYVLGGDRHLAEDLVQEVLARVYPRWHRMTQVGHLDAYLRTAVVRQFLSWRRRRSSRETSLDVLPERVRSTADGAVDHAARDEMWRLLAGLPRKQRAVLVLRYYEDLADARIAEVLGCRQTTVRVHASHGIARLRRLLGPSRSSVATPSAAELIGGDR